MTALRFQTGGVGHQTSHTSLGVGGREWGRGGGGVRERRRQIEREREGQISNKQADRDSNSRPFFWATELLYIEEHDTNLFNRDTEIICIASLDPSPSRLEQQCQSCKN